MSRIKSCFFHLVVHRRRITYKQVPFAMDHMVNNTNHSRVVFLMLLATERASQYERSIS